MKAELIKAMEESDHWKRATQAMNNVVEQMNLEGKKMTDRERDALRDMRILVTIYADPKVRKLVADDVWETLQARKEKA